MSVKISKSNLNNHSKEKTKCHQNHEIDNEKIFKRPDTATLERPSILDPSYLRKLDMSTISREKLMNIKNLLAKPYRKQKHGENNSSASSYDSILTDASMNISDESLFNSVRNYMSSDEDKTNECNKISNSKTSKSKKKSYKNNYKTKSSSRTSIDIGVKSQLSTSVKNKNEISDNRKQTDSENSFNWEDQEDYKYNNQVINRTYRIKNSSRQSIKNMIHLSDASNNDESSKTFFESSHSSEKLESSPEPIITPSQKDKSTKKSDDKQQPKLVVKKTMALNKYSKKSSENLAMKKSKSKEKINYKVREKSKKVPNSSGKDKKCDVDIKENSSSVANPIENKKVDLKKETKAPFKYETVPRQKRLSETGLPKQKSPSHRRSLSEVTKIDLDAKEENNATKKKFLRKNSRELNNVSTNVVRKFIDPITGKLRTVDEIPTAVKKIKETSLKTVHRGERGSPRKPSSSSENSPRKSSISDSTTSRLFSNIDVISPRKYIDSYPTRKSSLTETPDRCRKSSLNSECNTRRNTKESSNNGGSLSRQRKCSLTHESFSQPQETVIIFPNNENYHDLFKKSSKISRDDPPDISANINEINHHNPITPDLVPDICDDNNGLLNDVEFRSLIITPTFLSEDDEWGNNKDAQSSTGSLRKVKTIKCQFCLKDFGASNFTAHVSDCSQELSNDVICKLCNCKIPFPLVDIHEDHCKATSASSSPDQIMSPSRKPRTVICYLCGREFGRSSIGIHEPQCLKKWKIENDKLPPNLRRPEPQKPDVIHVEGTNKVDVAAMGEAAFKSYVAQLVPCGKCGRKFFPDRVIIHENVCKGIESRK